MKRTVLTICLLCAAATPAFSQGGTQPKPVTLEIAGVTPHRGAIHISVSRSEVAYKRRVPDLKFQTAPSGDVVRAAVAIPTGECVINVYQDLDGNGELASGMLGIPKEPVGITGWDGSGPPAGYNKLKISVTDATKSIRINLYKL